MKDKPVVKFRKYQRRVKIISENINLVMSTKAEWEIGRFLVGMIQTVAM